MLTLKDNNNQDEERAFEVVSDFGPAGDQLQAIEALSEGFRSGKKRQTLLGVTGSGKTFTMACVIEALQRPALVMAHNKTLAAQLYSEFKGFFPHNAVQYFVSYYDYYQPEAYMPSQDIYIEKDASINEKIEKLRLNTTKALLERRDVIVVASVSCIYGLGKRKNYEDAIFRFAVGERWPRRKFFQRLIDSYYDRNDISLVPGNFRVRGDMLEIYPAYSDTALRVAFFDDEIERIDEIDPVSGHAVLNKRKAAIFPAQHYVTSPEAIAKALQKIQDELKEDLTRLTAAGKLLEAQRLEMRTRYDMEMLSELGYCSGIENYSRFLDGRERGEPPGTLMDFFPKDYLLFLDESHITVPQIRGMYNGDKARKDVLVEHGFRLPSCLDNRPLKFEEFESFVDQALFVSATPGDYELNTSETVVEQLVRPTGVLDPIIEVRPATGQVDDLMEELRLVVERGERALVTTLTKRSAEELAEFLAAAGIKVRFIHSELNTFERADLLRDLRKGIFAVLVGVNLLREGIDLPEVSLVAIMEADREGYLRSFRSLIQTIGRAARNEAGKVILYADRITDSIKHAMEETDRRRGVQELFNAEHDITPTTIIKEVKSLLPEELQTKEGEHPYAAIYGQDVNNIKNEKKELERRMWEAVERLEFEEAAELRDILKSLNDGKPIKGQTTRKKASQAAKSRRKHAK